MPSPIVPSAQSVAAFRAAHSLAAPQAGPFRCRVMTDPAEIAAAKRLQGEAYVRHGHLDAARLTPEGWLPWHDDPPAAAWFGVFGARLVAAARLIGPGRLPALAHCPVPGPGPVVEPAGLAKAPGAPLIATLLIYRAFYRESLRRGDRWWVMTVAPALRATLRVVVPGALTIGSRAVTMQEQFPGVRVGAYAYPAWGEVSALTDGIRGVAAAAGDREYGSFLRKVADFLGEGES